MLFDFSEAVGIRSSVHCTSCLRYNIIIGKMTVDILLSVRCMLYLRYNRIIVLINGAVCSIIQPINSLPLSYCGKGGSWYLAVA